MQIWTEPLHPYSRFWGSVQNKDWEKSVIKKTNNIVKKVIEEQIISSTNHKNKPDEKKIIGYVEKEIEDDADLKEVIDKHLLSFDILIKETTEYYTSQTLSRFINIPIITIRNMGQEEYEFIEFELYVSNLNHVPLLNKLIVQNIEKRTDNFKLEVKETDYSSINPHKELIGL